MNIFACLTRRIFLGLLPKGDDSYLAADVGFLTLLINMIDRDDDPAVEPVPTYLLELW